MNKYISFGLLLFILSINQAFTQTNQPDQLLLNLNEGDRFSYEVKSSKSYLLTYPKDSVLRSFVARSKHTFYVEGKIPGNKYLIKYKIDYVISEDWSGSEVSIKDSRFPPFTNYAYQIAECFLNTVEYKILFSPLENSMQVLNREEINKKLIEYMKERGVHVSESIKRELGHRHTDYGILKRIQFLNFYPGGGNYKQNWTIDHITEEKETYALLGEEETIISILSTRNFYYFEAGPLLIVKFNSHEFELENLSKSNMDVNWIKRITVIKDSNAEELYGCRGRNGVVIIEFKENHGAKTYRLKDGRIVDFSNRIEECEPPYERKWIQ